MYAFCKLLLNYNILQIRLGHPVNRINIVAELCDKISQCEVVVQFGPLLKAKKIRNTFIYRQITDVYVNGMNKVSHFMVVLLRTKY